MIGKGESMLLQLGRVSMLAALTVFLLSSTGPAYGQDETAATATLQAAGDSDHSGEVIPGDSHGNGGSHGNGDAHTESDTHGEIDSHGESDGHGDPPGTPPLLQFDIGSAVCNIAIFLGVLAILSKFVWPVILGGLQAREDKIHEDLVGAENANQEAKAILAEYQAKLDDSAAKVQVMLAEARRDAEATGQRIVEDAKAEAERQRERAVADIETAKKVALSELAGQTSDMAISVAKQVVGRELKADDHADLIRQALDRLPSNN